MRATFALVFILWTLAFTGCPDSSEPMQPTVDPPEYSLDYTQLENLLADLQLSWIRREIDRYEDLLAEDYIFVFQEDDADGIPEGYWSKADDVLGMSRIFDSSQVTAIRMDLTWGAPESDAQTLTTGADATRITVSDTFLDVDLDGGETTLRVDGDVQEFYFALGDASKGEDPNRWYILEWVDLGATTRSFVESNTVGNIKNSLGDGKPIVESPTVSGIKLLYGARSAVEASSIGSIKKAAPELAVRNRSIGGLKLAFSKPVDQETISSIRKIFRNTAPGSDQ